MASLKTRFFEVGKFLKPEFTFVNEDFKNAAQRRKSSFSRYPKIKLKLYPY